MPPFLLQPLVENAIKHGVEPMERTVSIAIDVAEIGGSLSVSVRDDGTFIVEPAD